MQQHVSASYTPSSDTFPHVMTGDTITYLHSNERNPLWFKGSTQDGIEGFFPLDDFEFDPATSLATCLRNYDATELSIQPGDVVESLGKYGEWLQVLYNGQIGWIPENCCEPLDCCDAIA